MNLKITEPMNILNRISTWINFQPVLATIVPQANLCSDPDNYSDFARNCLQLAKVS